MAGTVSPNLPTIGQPNSTQDPKIRESFETLRNALNAILTAENKVDSSAFSFATSQLSQSKLVWYTPKEISEKQTRENTAFGFMTTEDKIQNVVLNAGAIMLLSYRAIVSSSVAAAGRVTIFLDNNQIKGIPTLTATPAVLEPRTISTSNCAVFAYPGGLVLSPLSSFVTTGQVLAGGYLPAGPEGSSEGLGIAWALGGFCAIFAAAGTYTVGIKYKATSGSISAESRVLNIATLG